MRIGLDTSVVVRLLTAEPAPLATAVALRAQQALRNRIELTVSDLVVVESYFALQHHYGLSKAQAIEAIRALLHHSRITCAVTTKRLLETPNLARANPGLADRIIHAEYTKGDGRMWTCERAAAKLPAVELLL